MRVEEVTKQYEDGRMDVITRGCRRFEVVGLNEEKPYLQGEVEFFDDDEPGPAALDLQEKALVQYRDLLAAGEFQRRARETVTALQAAGKAAVVVGGSGLYIRALIDGLFEGPEPEPALRARLQREAAELGPDNIRVNDINPVIGETALLEEFMGMPDTPENRQKFLATIPMGRMSKPQDVANAALYLASDEAGYITATQLVVDGGMTAARIA